MSYGEESAGYTGMSIFFPNKGNTPQEFDLAKKKLNYYKRTDSAPEWTDVLDAFFSFVASADQPPQTAVESATEAEDLLLVPLRTAPPKKKLEDSHVLGSSTNFKFHTLNFCSI